MAISLPEESPLQQRDCRAPLAMTVRAKLGTREEIAALTPGAACSNFAPTFRTPQEVSSWPRLLVLDT